MGGRNNKLCDQRGQDPKGGLAGKETHQKKSCRGSKGPFQCICSAKKQITNKTNQLQTKQNKTNQIHNNDFRLCLYCEYLGSFSGRKRFRAHAVPWPTPLDGRHAMCIILDSKVAAESQHDHCIK